MGLDGEIVPLDYFWPAKVPTNFTNGCPNYNLDHSSELCKADGEDTQNKFRLPYSCGQKYTFGTSFTSREEQGELVTLSGAYLKDPDDPFVCQILCEDDKYWVSSSRKNKIFLNELEITTKTELGFGDVLSLVEKDKVSGKYVCYFEQLRFLFQERQLTPVKALHMYEDSRTVAVRNKLVFKETSDDTSNFFVGQNKLIVSKILSYLHFSDVKRARLVSKTWNSEAIPFIQEKAEAQLKINPYDTIQTTMKLFLFCNDFKDNPGLVQKLELILPTCPSTHFGWGWPKTMNATKFTSNIHWFLGQVWNVTELNLNGTIVNSQEDFDTQIAILERFSGTLKKLELSGTWLKYRAAEESEYDSYHFPGTLKFPKLQSFTWSVTFSTADSEPHRWYDSPQRIDRDHAMNYNSSNFDWIGDLMQALSGVKELRIWAEPELGNFLARKLDSFRNLEELSLCHIISAELKEKLLELKNPLKSLTWDYLTQEDIPFFEELLQKQCNSLERMPKYFQAFGWTGRKTGLRLGGNYDTY